MSSYNRINGTAASENHWLLTEVLREDWGFEGLVVSDWFAVADRAKPLQAGLDLEMPTTGGLSRQRVLEALCSDELEESVLDDCAVRIIRLIQQVLQGAAEGSAAEDSATGASSAEAAAQAGAHHALAREAAARSAVLLKNEQQLLPLAPQSFVAVIGEFARQPRFQGAGSSQINPIHVDDACSAIADAGVGPVSFAPGFHLSGGESADSGPDQPQTGTAPPQRVRRAAPPPLICSSVRRTRRGGLPRPSRCASPIPLPTWTSPASTATCATARGSSWATAGTTHGRWRWPSRSVTA